jgi:hypothetical protein
MRLTVACLTPAVALGLGPGLAGAGGDRTPSPRPGEDPAYPQAVRAIDAGHDKAAIPQLACLRHAQGRRSGGHEYIGEAYLMLGDVGRAHLKQAIEAFERKATSGSR